MFAPLFLLALVAPSLSEVTKATIFLVPDPKNKLGTYGALDLEQPEPKGPLTITGYIYNLTEGLHGFHIHEKGDIKDSCMSTGAHYNPLKMSHGAPTDEERHKGDLGNIYADSNGVAFINVTDSVATLNGPYSVIGRGFVIHEGVDDLGQGGHKLSSTTGNAGGRLACGVIGIVMPDEFVENSSSDIHNISFGLLSLMFGFVLMIYKF